MKRQILLPLATLVAACSSSACLVGCGAEPARMTMTPAGAMENPMTETQPSGALDPANTVAILQGTQGRLADCSVGVVSVSGGAATLLGTRNGGSRQTVGKGDLFACGGLYRVVEVGDIRAASGSPIPGVVLDGRAVSAPGVTLAADGLVLPVGGRASLAPFEFSAITIEAGRARFHVNESAVRADGTFTSAERDVDLAAGDTVELGQKRYPILAVVPAGAAPGILGWIELSTRPLP